MKHFSSITTTQLAKICGVSQGTVDRALHDREGISEKTKTKILSVAREYGYVAHVDGASKTRSMLIGVVLFDLKNEFFSKLAMSLVEKAKIDGYSVIFLFSNKDLKAERRAIDYFNYIGVDGIVLFPVGTEKEEYKNYLKSICRPIVTVGNRLFDLPYIGVDDYRAMYDLTCMMQTKVNDDKLQYFAPILKKELHENNAQILRYKGFEKAMEDNRFKYDLIFDEKDLSNKAKGIICSTDHYVLKVMKKLGRTNKTMLAGFDNISMLEKLGKEILTIDYSTDEIAVQCMNYFLRRKHKSEISYSIIYGGQLVDNTI